MSCDSDALVRLADNAAPYVTKNENGVYALTMMLPTSAARNVHGTSLKKASTLQATSGGEDGYVVVETGAMGFEDNNFVDVSPAVLADPRLRALCTCGVPFVHGRPCSHYFAALKLIGAKVRGTICLTAT